MVLRRIGESTLKYLFTLAHFYDIMYLQPTNYIMTYSLHHILSAVGAKPAFTAGDKFKIHDDDGDVWKYMLIGDRRDDTLVLLCLDDPSTVYTTEDATWVCEEFTPIK